MDLVNFWVAYNNIARLDDVEGLLPTIPVPVSEGIAQGTHMQPPPATQARLFGDGAWKVRSLYRRIEDISDVVVLRESLQWLEEDFSGDFYVCGMWSYKTGEPIGGVGSPWFVKPVQLASMLPNGVVEDVVLLAGQAPRKFV